MSGLRALCWRRRTSETSNFETRKHFVLLPLPCYHGNFKTLSRSSFLFPLLALHFPPFSRENFVQVNRFSHSFRSSLAKTTCYLLLLNIAILRDFHSLHAIFYRNSTRFFVFSLFSLILSFSFRDSRLISCTVRSVWCCFFFFFCLFYLLCDAVEFVLKLCIYIFYFAFYSLVLIIINN